MVECEETNENEPIVDEELLEQLKGTTFDLYMVGLANLKRTFDAYQDLDLTRARQEIHHREELDKLFSTHLASVLADDRQHQRELLADRNKRYAYDTDFLYTIHPQEALGLSIVLRQFWSSSEFLTLLADWLKNKAEESKEE